MTEQVDQAAQTDQIFYSDCTTTSDSTSCKATPNLHSEALPFVIFRSDEGCQIVEDSNTFTPRRNAAKSSSDENVINSEDKNQLNTSPRADRTPRDKTPPSTLKVEYVDHVWDSYIANFLCGSNDIKEAAIYDKSSLACVSRSQGFHLLDGELEHLVQSLGCLRLAYRYFFIYILAFCLF